MKNIVLRQINIRQYFPTYIDNICDKWSHERYEFTLKYKLQHANQLIECIRHLTTTKKCLAVLYQTISQIFNFGSNKLWKHFKINSYCSRANSSVFNWSSPYVPLANMKLGFEISAPKIFKKLKTSNFRILQVVRVRERPCRSNTHVRAYQCQS